MTLNLTDYLISLSGSNLTITKVIVVYGDIEMTRVWSSWRHRLCHVTSVLKERLDEILRWTRALLDDSRDKHRGGKIVRL